LVNSSAVCGPQNGHVGDRLICLVPDFGANLLAVPKELNFGAGDGAAGNAPNERHAVRHQSLPAVAGNIHCPAKKGQRGTSSAVQIDCLHAAKVEHDLSQFRERHANGKVVSSVYNHEPEITDSGAADGGARVPLVCELGAKALCGRGDIGGARLHQRWPAADDVVDLLPVEAGRLPFQGGSRSGFEGLNQRGIRALPTDDIPIRGDREAVCIRQDTLDSDFHQALRSQLQPVRYENGKRDRICSHRKTGGRGEERGFVLANGFVHAVHDQSGPTKRSKTSRKV